MGRRVLPPRLRLRRRGRNGHWYIVYKRAEYSLDLDEHQKDEAEKALLSFKARGGQWRRRLKGHKTGSAGTGTVYFLRLLAPVDEQPIKIGFTSKEEARFHQVRTSSPWPLQLLASISAHQNTEIAIHEVCSEARMQGEWFRPASIVLAAVMAAQDDTILQWLETEYFNREKAGNAASSGQKNENIQLSV